MLIIHTLQKNIYVRTSIPLVFLYRSSRYNKNFVNFAQKREGCLRKVA